MNSSPLDELCALRRRTERRPRPEEADELTGESRRVRIFSSRSRLMRATLSSISSERVLLDALAGEDLGAHHHTLTPGRSEVSFTSPAFSPKMARSSFSSGESCVSPFGVILPTRMSPDLT